MLKILVEERRTRIESSAICCLVSSYCYILQGGGEYCRPPSIWLHPSLLLSRSFIWQVHEQYYLLGCYFEDEILMQDYENEINCNLVYRQNELFVLHNQQQRHPYRFLATLAAHVVMDWDPRSTIITSKKQKGKQDHVETHGLSIFPSDTHTELVLRPEMETSGHLYL